MIPYILAAVGGYLIGDSLKGKQYAENYSDGGRISKGVKWKQEWTDTKGVEGYDVLEIEDTKYFSNNYGGGIVVRSRIIQSSKPERVGNYQEDSKTELRKIFSGKYPFAYKYAEGGMMAVNYEKIKNYPTFETEEEAKKFIKIGKPFLRKELKEGKIVLLYNGKEYFLAYVKENGEGEKMALGKMAKGGGVESYSELRKVPKKVAGELTLSPSRTAKLTANKLMLIDNNIWEELDINSGSQLYNDDELQKKYVEKLEKAKVDKIISSENLIRSKVMDLLEEDNYSSLHQYFIYKGIFGEAKRNDYINRYNSGGSYMFLNPALFTRDLHGKPFPNLNKPKMAKGGQVYKLGDKWSPNFDYTGMLETALKADVSWGIDKLKKLYDSLEDVNYHTASRSLWEALKSLKDNDVKAAEKHLENFRADVMEEMK